MPQTINVERMRRYTRPGADLTDLRDLDPALKVRLIEAMGFTPGYDPHTYDCPANLGSGYRCNCVPDGTTWSPPKDVQEHRGETYEQRRAASLARG